LPGKKKTSARGVSHAHPLLCFKFCFILFLLASFYQKHKNIIFPIVVFNCLFLVLLEWLLLKTPSCVILLALIIVILSAPPAPDANFYEIKPALLNLVMKD
jgi:hypothetical protein